MKTTYDIKNFWTGKVIYTAEIECADDASDAVKRGMAAVAALRDGVSLRNADLSGAYLIGAPVVEGIHKRVYDAATADPELFDMSTFATGTGHGCGTAQCRAGWVIHVAGHAGLDLEDKIGTPAAAMAIYLASDPERWKNEPTPDFFTTTNEAALADMARMAGVTE